MLARKASSVCPLSVRPARSLTVTESIMGRATPRLAITSIEATMAALALSVSNMVSMSSASTPPSIMASTCSRYASASSSNVSSRAAGLLTSGLIEQVLLVGPIEPATNLGCPPAEYSSAALRAMRAPSSAISRQQWPRP